jgi:hypothetical protein
MPMVAGLFIAATLTPLTASAASLSTPTMAVTSDIDRPLVQNVEHRSESWRYDDGRRYHRHGYHHTGGYDRCRWVRHACADRYGWGTWEYRRCVAWRGCGRAHRWWRQSHF